MKLIEALLVRWGQWARESIALNVKPLAMFNDGSGVPTPLTMTDDEAASFDPAVAMLKLIDKELYDVVRLHYIYRLSFNAIGRLKGCNSKTIFDRCRLAEQFISGYLHGVERTLHKFEREGVFLLP